MKKEYKAIIFDVDGTLLDSYFPAAYCMKRALEEFQIPYTEEQIHLGYGMTDPDFIQFMGMDPSSERGKKFLEREYFYYAEALDQLALFPDIEVVLKQLKEQSILLGILTSRSYKDFIEEATLKPIIPYFDAIVTRDDTSHHKPDKEPMECALKKLKLLKEEVLYVGDTIQDYCCAKQAGVPFGLAKWGEVDSSVPTDEELPTVKCLLFP